MTSAPPLPSIELPPEPPVITLTPDEPVIDALEESAEASTFWKFDTTVTSPDVWSTDARFTMPVTLITSVLLSAPPSIDVSVPQ